MPLDPIAYKPYADPDDFIREVTDLIWVNRAIGYIRENYEPDSIVHGAYGTSVGRDEVIEGSLMRISATPDRIGQAEDVIWEARGDDAFLSSHLVLSADPNNDFVSRTIANCLYRRGRMVEEWVVRDSLAIALQQGQDPDELARQKAFRGYIGSFTQPAADRRDSPSATAVRGRTTSGPRCEMVLEFIQRVWNDRELEKVDDFWIRDLVLHDRRSPHDHPARGLPTGAAAADPRPSRPGSSRSATCRPTSTRATPDCGSRCCGSSAATTTAPPTSVR